MANVPNPFYTNPSFGKGVAAVVQAFTPDPTSTLRAVQAQKTAYETREIRDRVTGRQELGNTLSGFDVNAPDAMSKLSRVIIDAYSRGLGPKETAEFVRSLVSNAGANEAMVTRAMVGAGTAPGVNQGVTYADLQGRRSQIENEAARRTGITAGATIRAAQIGADERARRPVVVPGAVYIPGQGYVENPHAPERFTSVAPGNSVFSQKDRTFVGTAPGGERKDLLTVSPGATVLDANTRLPVYTAPDRSRDQGFTLSPGQRRYGPDGKLITDGPPDRSRALQGPTLGFGADKQILSAIDERFGVVRDPRERERMGLKPADRLPLDPAIEQSVKTRATQYFMDPASPGYKNAGVALDLAVKEIVGDQSSLEPGGAAPDERSLIGRVFSSAPPPQYRVLKKDAKPGAANAMQKATERAPGAPAQPATPSTGAAPPAAPTGRGEPLPYSPDGKVDGRRLKVGAVYDTPKGRLRWNGKTMDPAE